MEELQMAIFNISRSLWNESVSGFYSLICEIEIYNYFIIYLS